MHTGSELRVPSVVQCEAHPFCHQEGLRDYCNKVGIQFQSFSPLGYGMFKNSDEMTVLSHDIINEIANKHGVSRAQVSVCVCVCVYLFVCMDIF